MSNIKVISLFFTLSGLVKSSQPSPEPQGLFLQANHQIQATIDALFATLRINNNFTKFKNVEHYLSLNNFVQDKVKKNDKIYQTICTHCKSTSSNKTGDNISNIDQIIGEMIRMQKVTISEHLLNKRNSRNTTHNRIVKEIIKLAKSFHLTLNTPSPYELLGVQSGNKWPERNGRGADTRRIFNGTATKVARYPFMASLHVRGRFVCAGSLVRADLVITAASGLIPLISPQSNPRSVKVRVGSDYTNKFGELVPVAGFYFHPKFNRTTLRSNLAIIQLKKPLKLADGKLTAIHYDTTADQLPVDVDKILLLGWGEKRASRELGYKYDGSDQKLSSALLNLQDLKECKYTYSRTYVSNKHFCASSDNNGGGACQFDVGGPAIAGRMLVGVASFGAPRCGERDAPTVFTKLGYYADWIESFFKENPPRNKQEPDSDKVPADEKQFYHRLVKTGLKSAKQKVLQDLLYGLEYDDVFKKTTKLDPQTRLDTDRATVLVSKPLEYEDGIFKKVDDTFKKTTKQNTHTRLVIDKAIFLDPKHVPSMPHFSGFGRPRPSTKALVNSSPIPDPGNNPYPVYLDPASPDLEGDNDDEFDVYGPALLFTRIGD